MSKQQELTLEQVTNWIRSQTDYDAMLKLNRDVLVPHLRYIGATKARDVISEVRAGDVVFVKWSDGYIYPLVVTKTPTRNARKNVQATYVYENGQVENWNVPGPMVLDLVKVEPEEFDRDNFISMMDDFIADKSLQAEPAENTNFFLNTIEAHLKKRS